MTPQRSGLIVVSNRLPLIIEKQESGWALRPSSGGLVTALAPVLQKRNGTWIGWTGTDQEDGVEDVLREYSDRNAFDVRPVFLTPEEKERFYQGFSNEIIWPLFHDLQSRCNFDPKYWESFEQVNARFAEVTARSMAGNEFIWVHDYHLMNVSTHLRRRGVKSVIGFFLHIPFPPPDIFAKLPWRMQILRGILDFDVVGFQTPNDRRNFIHCVREFLDNVNVSRTGENFLVEVEGHRAVVGSFPIGIDAAEFEELAASDSVSEHAAQIRRELGTRIILGVDRLDYTKGVVERLKAFRHLLARHPELEREITYVQVVVPSRADIPKYRDLKHEIEQLVSRINGKYTVPGWVPIHYLYRPLPREELLAFYRTADVALITPLKDGMNLVAKEYCACDVEEKGVLVLSEFAGAAAQLKNGSIQVNPYDEVGVAEAVCRALNMSMEERRNRMRALRRTVARYEVFRWAERFLETAMDPSRPFLSTPAIAAEKTAVKKAIAV